MSSWKWYGGVVGGTELFFEAKIEKDKPYAEVAKPTVLVMSPQGIGFKKIPFAALDLCHTEGLLSVSGTVVFEAKDEVAQQLTKLWSKDRGPGLHIPTPQEKSRILQPPL